MEGMGVKTFNCHFFIVLILKNYEYNIYIYIHTETDNKTMVIFTIYLIFVIRLREV